MRILLENHPVDLLPESGVLLPESRTLVIADVHLGKSATFRARGIPVPEGDTQRDLEKISQLIDTHEAQQLIIAGDLVHASDGLTDHILTTLRQWLETLDLPVILTEGNHDKKSHLPPLPLDIRPAAKIDGLTITHHPSDLPEGRPGIAGHLHPSYRLKADRHKSVQLRGFYHKHPCHLILPAFSQFTGTHNITPKPGDHFCSITEGKLHRFPIGSV